MADDWKEVSLPRFRALSPSRRVRRGFTRLGFTLAVLVGIVGLVTSVIVSINIADAAMRNHDGMMCLKKAWAEGRAYAYTYDKSRANASASGCSWVDGPAWTALSTYNSPAPSWVGAVTLGVTKGLAATAAIAAAFFCLTWALGWIIAGFLKD